jgi:hypothetical protein
MESNATTQFRYVSWSEIDWHQRTVDMAMTIHSPYLKVNLEFLFFIYGTQVLALYIGIELIIETLLRFSSWTSLYFWSLLATSCGVIVYTIFNLIINISRPFGSDAMNALSFVVTCCVTTGFALVLYSRLYTIVQERNIRLLRLLLGLILCAAIALRIPQIVLMVMIDNAQTATVPIATLSSRIWHTDYGFTLSEILISSIYIWWFYTYLDDLPDHMKASFESEKRKTMIWLVACFVVNLMLGVLQMVLIITKLRLISDIYWTVSYAIKLKLEFVVLNRLTKVTEAKRAVLAEGNWAHGLPVIASSARSDGGVSQTATTDAMEAASPPSATNSWTSKRDDHRSATDQLERMYLGRFLAEK